jgi:cell shape-determining protein MreC
MIYRQDKINKNRIYKLVFLAVFLLIIATPLGNFFGNIAINIFSGAGAVKANAEELVESTELSLMSKKQLIEKIKVQEEEINRLSIVENMYKELTVDYQKTITLLDIKNQFLELVLAEVLSSPSQSIYNTVLISKSFNVGSFVFSQSGIPIGTIESSSNKNSTVLFFSHSGRETEAFLNNDTTPVTLVGKGSGNFTISLPREIEVAEGESVYLPGIKNPIAKVGYVEFDPRDPFQTVYLLSEQNVYKLDYVLVQSQNQ